MDLLFALFTPLELVLFPLLDDLDVISRLGLVLLLVEHVGMGKECERVANSAVTHQIVVRQSA